VTVVSHKSEYGHGDVDRVPLRQTALRFLTAQGLLGSSELIQEVVFENTRDEKIMYISNQAFDYFVDDLDDVVFQLRDLAGLTVVHFDPASNMTRSGFAKVESAISLSDWQQVDALINGEWTIPEIDRISRQLTHQEAITVERHSAGGNAAVYRVGLQDRSAVRIKLYPADGCRDRLSVEFTATRVMSGLARGRISQPLAKDSALGIGVFEWIEGERVVTVGQHDMESSLEFLRDLHAARHSDQFAEMGQASAACLSGRDIEIQIRRRLRQFDSARTCHPELDGFIATDFLPTFGKLFEWALDNWPRDHGFDSPLDRNCQTLSPSDFGFHNAIRRPDGSLAFIDFEYFGWDDPVKLMSDFIFHQGMSLTDQQKSYWLDAALHIYGEHRAARLNACLPLYGLIWCLILLNDFRPEVWHRRSLADSSKKEIRSAILDRQLARAQALLLDIAVGYSGLFAGIRH
jgi:hypothetical protein